MILFSSLFSHNSSLLNQVKALRWKITLCSYQTEEKKNQACNFDSFRAKCAPWLDCVTLTLELFVCLQGKSQCSS